MEGDSWSDRLSTSSRRLKSALNSRSDLYLGFEEIDGDEDMREEYPCPFCSEDFDIIGLCCHIDDEHPVEAKNGVCPVCAMRVGTDMVGHITMQHGYFFKMQRRKRFHKGGPHSTLSLLRKELREGNLQSLRAGSRVVSSTSAAPDPLLSSFMYNLPLVDEPESIQPHSLTEESMVKGSTDLNVLERSVQPPPLSEKDHEERTRRSEFVQGLLMSTILDDTL